MGNRGAEGTTGARRFAWALAALSVAALVLRVVLVLTRQDGAQTGSIMLIGGDGVEYWAVGRSLAEGGGFVGMDGPSARPPLWPAVLSLGLRVSGTALRDAQLVAALVGATAVPLSGLAARRVAGRRAGLATAAAVAVWPGFWLFEWTVLSETLLLPLVALFLLVVYRFIDGPGTLPAAAMGAVVGLLALTRSEQILLAVLVVAPAVLLVRDAPWRRRIGWAAAAGACCLVVLVPWLAYNQGRFEHPVYLSSGVGNTLLAGMCDKAVDGDVMGLYDTRCNVGLALRADAEGRVLDYTEADAERLDAALERIEDRTGDLPKVVVAREGRVWGFYRPGHTANFWQDWSKAHPLAVDLWIRLAPLLLVAAAAGALVLRRRGRPVYPLLAMVGLVVVTVAATIGEPRYRAAAELPLTLLAVVAGLAAWDRVRRPGRDTARDDEPEDGGASTPAAPAAPSST